MIGGPATTFNFELVSPERKLVSEPALMVTIPGEEGEFGVLAGHCSLVASVRPGVVIIHLPDNTLRRIFIAGGFADVSATNCTVLAEEAVNINDLDRASLGQQLKDLGEDLALATTDIEKNRIVKKKAVTLAKLDAVAGHVAVH